MGGIVRYCTDGFRGFPGFRGFGSFLGSFLVVFGVLLDFTLGPIRFWVVFGSFLGPGSVSQLE